MELATFREQFPEFANTTSYPDPMVEFWSDLADSLISEDKWGTSKSYGVSLFTAHQLVLAKSNVDSTGLPGQTAGPANSKTVGSASVSYDTSSSTELSAGHWNMTSYGKQYIRLARMFGVGTRQL